MRRPRRWGAVWLCAAFAGGPAVAAPPTATGAVTLTLPSATVTETRTDSAGRSTTSTTTHTVSLPTLSPPGSPTGTASASTSYSRSRTATASATASYSGSRTGTASATASLPSISATASATGTPSATATTTAAATASLTLPSLSVTATATVPTATDELTQTLTVTETMPSSTVSSELTVTQTNTLTLPQATDTATETRSATLTLPTLTATLTRTLSASVTLPTATATATLPTATSSATLPSVSASRTQTRSGTLSATGTPTPTPFTHAAAPVADDDAPADEVVVRSASDDDGVEAWVWVLVAAGALLCCGGLLLLLWVLCSGGKKRQRAKPQQGDREAPAPKESPGTPAAAAEREWQVGDPAEVRHEGEWIRGVVEQVVPAKSGPPAIWVTPEDWGGARTFPEIRRPRAGDDSAQREEGTAPSGLGGASVGASDADGASAAPGATVQQQQQQQASVPPPISVSPRSQKKVRLWDLRQEPAQPPDPASLWSLVSAVPPTHSPAAAGAGETAALRMELQELRGEVRRLNSALSEHAASPAASPHHGAGDSMVQATMLPAGTGSVSATMTRRALPAGSASPSPTRAAPPPRPPGPGSPGAGGPGRASPPPPGREATKVAPGPGMLHRGPQRQASGGPGAPAAATPPQSPSASPPPPISAGLRSGPAGVWAYDQGRRYAVAPDGAGGMRYVEHTADGLLSGPLLRSHDMPPPQGFAAHWAVPLTRHSRRSGGPAPGHGTLWLLQSDATTMRSGWQRDKSSALLVNTAVRCDAAAEWEAEADGLLPPAVAAAI
eukprot:TRINITY_DN6983_c1_g1_i1.p1 TRINITY_DN6983_c1_g1~~TRINITY_DN6983_c1_g1_i1.p1  ORF type:complete len:859 (+),score=196.40 TRINITY_DN6983_c1_g1_i1:216-2579(+)